MKLAELLAAKRDDLLDAFVERSRRAGTAEGHERPTLVDDLPEFLDELTESLACLDAITPDDSRPSEPARAHGRQRHRMGFALDDVVREYGLLRGCIYDLAEQHRVPITLAEHRRVAERIDEGVIAAVREYTEQRRRDVELQVIRLRTVLDILPVAIFITDAAGVPEEVNTAANRLWREPPRIDMRHYDRFRGWFRDGRPIAAGDWTLARALTSGERQLDEELTIETFDGRRRVIDSYAAPIQEADGKIVGGVAASVDVTDRVAALRAREDALATVAHDLKNPLSATQLHASRLARVCNASNAQTHVDGITRGIMRMRQLVDDLLTFARAEAGRLTLMLEHASIAEIVHESVALAEPLADERGLRIEVELAGEPLFVTADRDRLLRVFENLLGNAVKFSNRGGVVRVRAHADGDRVIVAVEDQGIGMTPEQTARAFERYWQAPEATRRGTGLGLAIAKAIVDAHGGRISLVSSPGEGTTFTLELPRGK